MAHSPLADQLAKALKPILGKIHDKRPAREQIVGKKYRNFSPVIAKCSAGLEGLDRTEVVVRPDGPGGGGGL
jgi:hypothetical protein